MEIGPHKLPPQNFEAEQSVLGGIILENRLMVSEVEGILSADDFYRDSHLRIFEAISGLLEQGGAADLVTLINELRRREQLDAIGGALYIDSLIEAIPTTANIKDYIEIVRQKAIFRMAIQFATEIITKAYEDNCGIADILTLFQEATTELAKKAAKGQEKGKRITPAMIYKHFSDFRATPFPSLDEAVGAFFAGELIIFGGRTGMGKTALMLECIKQTAIKENRPCAFFHAQMDELTLRTRLLSSVSGVPYNDLRKGNVAKGQEAKKVLLAQGQIDDAPISWFIKKGELETDLLIAEIRKFVDKKGGAGLVAIENLQQVRRQTKEKFTRDRKQEADIIINRIRELGIETKVPHLVSSQLTRDSEKEKRPPQIGDLKETGRTGEIADKVIMPYRPNYEDKTCKLGEAEDAELIVCKGGLPVRIPIKFIGKILTWREAI